MTVSAPQLAPVDHLQIDWIALPCGTPHQPFRVAALAKMSLSGPPTSLVPAVWILGDNTAIRYGPKADPRCWIDAVSELTFEAYIDGVGGPYRMTPTPDPAGTSPRTLFLRAFDEDVVVAQPTGEVSLRRFARGDAIRAPHTSFITEITQYLYAAALADSLDRSGDPGMGRGPAARLFSGDTVREALPKAWQSRAGGARARYSRWGLGGRRAPPGEWTLEDPQNLTDSSQAISDTLDTLAPSDAFIYPTAPPSDTIAPPARVEWPCDAAPTLHFIEVSSGAPTSRYALPQTCSPFQPVAFQAMTADGSTTLACEVSVQGGGSIGPWASLYVPERSVVEFQHIDERWELRLQVIKLSAAHLGKTILLDASSDSLNARVVAALPESPSGTNGDLLRFENIGTADAFITAVPGEALDAPDRLPGDASNIPAVLQLLKEPGGQMLPCWTLRSGNRLTLYRVSQSRKLFWHGHVDERREFHALLTYIGSHSALVGLFRFRIDLELSPEGVQAVQKLSDSEIHRLKICVSRKSSATQPAFDGIAHWTAFLRQPGTGDSWWTVAPHDPPTPSVEFGVLSKRFTPGRFQLVSFDAETAAAKLTQASTNAQAADVSPPTKVSVAADALPDRSDPTPPAISTGGIGLYDAEHEMSAVASVRRAIMLIDASRKALAVNPVSSECASSSETIFMEDVLRGFRVDARISFAELDCGSWLSLSARELRYWFGKKNGDTPDFSATDEAPTGSSGQEKALDSKGSPQTLATSRAMFQWGGWNLGVPRSTPSLDPDGRTLQEEPKPQDQGSIILRSSAIDVLPLRYGASYRFRLRSVDAGGGGLSSDDIDALVANGKIDEETFVFRSQPFARTHPVVAPKIISATALSGTAPDGMLLVRSFDNGRRERREWWIVPPTASFEEFARHGVLDALPAKEVYRELEHHNERLPDGSTPTPPKEWAPVLKALSRGQVPFLADPLSSGAIFRCLPNDHCHTTLRFAEPSLYERKPIPKYPQPDRLRPVKLRLIASDREESFCSRETVTVSLPPGRSWSCELASAVPTDFPSLFAVTTWLGLGGTSMRATSKRGNAYEAPISDEVTNAFSKGKKVLLGPLKTKLATALETGQLQMIAPARTITFLHATQRPLLPEGRKAIEFARHDTHDAIALRRPGESQVILCGAIHIDCPSTGRLDFEAQWRDPVDDPTVPNFGERPGKMVAFFTTVPPPFDVCHLAESAEYGPLPEDPRTNADGKALIPDTGFPFAGSHKWNDLKHHVAVYFATATSRWADYFPEFKKDPSALTRVSQPWTVHIPSAAAPATPSPLYVIPAFKTERSETDAWTSQSRVGGWLRIYLERDWFSSGHGEQLAVVLRTITATGLSPAESRVVTEWGTDPIWSSAPLSSFPTLDNLEGAQERIAAHRLHIPTESEERSNAGGIRRSPSQEEFEVALAIFDVKVDATRNLLYADLRVNLGFGGGYIPFVRFALARYQKYSVKGLELSPVMQTHFVQLTPTRTASFHRLAADRIRLAVSGPTQLSEPSREVIEVSFDTNMFAKSLNDAAGWVPLDPGHYAPQQLERHLNGDGTAVWSGEIGLPEVRGTLRCVAKGYQVLDVLADDKNPTGPVELARRLVYAETFEIH
jgi:hypothetical protein